MILVDDLPERSRAQLVYVSFYGWLLFAAANRFCIARESSSGTPDGRDSWHPLLRLQKHSGSGVRAQKNLHSPKRARRQQDIPKERSKTIHPSSCLWRDRLPHSCEHGLDERRKAGLLASRSSYSLRLTISFGDSGSALRAVEAFVTRYSGATARDFNPFPYSPLADAKGTFSR